MRQNVPGRYETGKNAGRSNASADAVRTSRCSFAALYGNRTASTCCTPDNPALSRKKADARIRTADPFITSEVLYQLSYVGVGSHSSALASPALARRLPKGGWRARNAAPKQGRVKRVAKLILGLACVGVVLLLPGRAAAAGGHYSVDGGTVAERGQVRAALEASTFNWNVVPGTVAIHIRRGIGSQATPGEIWLDADLLDAGSFSWGVVQHEYAHQVDYLLLTPTDRDQIQAILGGSSWCSGGEGLAHDDNTCERFATAVAWAYWPSAQNAFDPTRASGESWLRSAPLRALLGRLIGVPDPYARVLGSATARKRP
jgi:hypothetical protein